MNNQKSYWIKLGGVVVTGLLVAFFRTSKPNETTIWGDDENEPYIAFKGKKPVDLHVKGAISFWLKGNGCERYSEQQFGQKLRRNGKLYVEYDHDFSDNSEYFELRLPYQNVKTSNGCSVRLNSMEVVGYNEFSDSVVTLGARPHLKSNLILPSNLIIEARHCNAQISQFVNKYWDGFILCKKFNNKSQKNWIKPSRSNLSDYNFSLSPNKTEIEFNIYAGELYRSEPLDEAKLRGIVGKLSSERDIASADKKTSLLSLLRKKIQDGKQK